MATPEDLRRCAQKMKQAKKIIVLVGPGMSAESGVSTFRGSGALWDGFFGKVSMGVFGTPAGWSWMPASAWSQYLDKFYNPIKNSKPNPGHAALVELEKACEDLTVITENVDGYQQEAGSNPDLVFEIHGSARKYCCIKSRHPYEDFGTKDLPKTSPLCKVEGCGRYVIFRYDYL
ncbi:NAD-dependent protein deacylase [Acrasis kona]|uniref:NAD-dependent protein deacylase n=1 Tax=Acrasis kona TaxID=1008807 RepID=A0AAW2ZIJ1_9EUKA